MKASTRREPAELARTGKGIVTRVNADGLKALRMLALERDTTLQAICVEALNDVLRKYGRRGIVKNPLLEL